MTFYKRYNNLLFHLPPSIIHELWVCLTTRKNDSLSETEASKINPKVEALIQHEIDKYNRKKTGNSLGMRLTKRLLSMKSLSNICIGLYPKEIKKSLN